MKEIIITCFCLVVMSAMIPDCSSSGSSSSGSSSTSYSELSKREKAENIIKSQLNYPSSYSLQGWAVDGNVVTLEYKAKNSFGMEKTQRQTIRVD